MSELISLVSANKNLRYVDPGSGKELRFDEINFPLHDDVTVKRNLVFLYLDNSIHSVQAFWNFYNSKHVLALLSANLKPELKSNLERLYDPGFIYDAKRADIENYSADQVNPLVRIFKNENETEKKIAPELKVLLSTSGTTGSPKFVKLSEKNMVSNAYSILDYLPVNAADVTPLNLPIHYSYGLSVFMTNSIAGGKIICTTKDILQKEFWTDFENYRCTSLAGVPYVYETLHRTGFTKKIFPSLKYLTAAGGKLSEDLVTVFSAYAQKNNTRFFIMYGQTEATARMSFLDPDMLKSKKMSIGKPIKNGRFEIDPETNELLYYGENVFGGYVNSVQGMETFDQQEPLRTGDLATVDADGFYFITGRIKRMVKLFGNRINLDEIEKALNTEFKKTSFICTGMDDKMLLVGVKNKFPDEKTITRFLSAQFAIHPAVVLVKQVDEIPLTENQKINYSKFIEQHGNR